VAGAALGGLIGINGAMAADLVPPEGEASFITRCAGDQLCLDGEVFRFVSFNAPELSMRENPYWDVEAPFDQEDIIRTIAEFGGRVTRTYVLSIGGAGKEPVHVTGPGQYGEEAFESLDRVLALASKYDVKIIIPFIDTWEWWGGIPQFTAMYGLKPEDFWTSDVMKDAYKDLVAHLVNRRNSVTGVLYKNDPAVFGWETGNELRAAPAEWTIEMAAYIKSLDANHIVIDGNDEHHDSRVLDDPNIDLVTRHYYGSDFRNRFLADLKWTGGKKPIIVGEFGLASLDEIKGVVDAVVEEATSGALIWSLRNHDSQGGWHWHCEAGGTCAYHVPGFASGDAYAEKDVLALLKQAAWAVRGEAMPRPTPPDVPQLLPIVTPLDIRWLGSAGADRYDIARSADQGASWETIGTDISDSLNTHESRILADQTDAQSGRLHEAVLTRIVFQDLTAEAGARLLYRIRAKGPGGASDWSAPIAATIALTEGLRILAPDDVAAMKLVTRFSEAGPVRRIEILTDADAFATDAACWPQVVAGKERLEVNVLDAPEVNAKGATLVTADDAAIGNAFAIAQPCRGQVNIVGFRYALGRYDLDAPRLPVRELPVDVIDQFETYADGFGDNWKPHPSGNKTSFAISDAGTGDNHLVVQYELGTPNYSGVQRFLQRDNWRQFDAITFKYRGEGGAHDLTVQFRADSGYWETSVAPPPADWTEITIPFTDFHEPPWSEQGRTLGVVGVTEFSLYVGGDAGGSYEIDDIKLRPKP
jgi:hypothetical protein